MEELIGLYITSSGISYLAQLLLTISTVHIILRTSKRSLATWYLTGFLIGIAGFQFILTAIYTTISWNLFALQYLFLQIALAFLIRFAYQVPYPLPAYDAQKSQGTLYFSIFAILLALFQSGLEIIAGHNTPSFTAIRNLNMLVIIVQAAMILIILCRRTRDFSRLETGQPLSIGEALRRPGGKAAHSTRAFALAFSSVGLIILWATLYHLTNLIPITIPTYETLLGIGMLGCQFIFALTYLNYAPTPHSFMSKLILSTLTTVLVTVAVLGQFMLTTDQDEIIRRTKDWSQIAQNQIETGTLAPQDVPEEIDFIYSRPISIVINTAYTYRLDFVRDPQLFPAPEFSEPPIAIRSNLFTFRPGIENYFQPLLKFSSAQRIYYLCTRFIHQQKPINRQGLPVILVLIFSSIVIGLVFPLFFHISLVQPLEQLQAGVREVESGNLNIDVPIQYNDEIGFLTEAFNLMVTSIRESSAALQQLNAELEQRVAERTAELAAANTHLQEYATALEARNSELDAFAHTVAHDLKTPLTSLIGFSSLLEKRFERMPPEKIHENLVNLTQTGHKMTSIINELLLLASIHRMDEVTLGPLNMADILTEACHRLETVLNESQATLELPTDWPTALGYAPWIEEVWANYLSNAVKYGGTPPHITLGAETRPDGYGLFWIEDNGLGLSPETQSRLFLPFTRLDQTRARGHGLGLSIVRRIIEKLGGQVGAENLPTGGSRFWFTLPLS